DIDAFRAFNDRYGHAEGDRALARLGEILRQELRKVDNACRYGGEEFAVLLPRCGAGAVERLAERLRRRIAAEVFTIAGQRAPLTVSIGAAVYPPGSPVERFIRSVDDALCRAKAGGRNRVVLAWWAAFAISRGRPVRAWRAHEPGPATAAAAGRGAQPAPAHAPRVRAAGAGIPGPGDPAGRRGGQLRQARGRRRHLLRIAFPLADPHLLVEPAVERAGRGDADHPDRQADP